MVGWHHLLNGDEFKQAPGDSEGWGSLACCSAWGCKESDMTEQLNNYHHFPQSYKTAVSVCARAQRVAQSRGGALLPQERSRGAAWALPLVGGSLSWSA